MTKHTPGPWANTITTVWDSDRRLVADAAGDNLRTPTEAIANALLIAAAPSLLLACKAAYATGQLGPNEKDIIRAAVREAIGEPFG